MTDRGKIRFSRTIPHEMEKGGYVYILASRRNGTLYTGVTSDLIRRVHEHRTGSVSSFTEKYGVYRLVWFDRFDDIETAICHEKRLKRWRRDWKINLIERLNPHWDDLYPSPDRHPGSIFPPNL